MRDRSSYDALFANGEDEAMYAVDRGTHWTLEPERTWEGKVSVSLNPAQPYGWSYRSDTNADRLGAERLREMVA